VPLISKRTVLITVARETEAKIRVNVFPKLKDGENPALATPLSYIGTPEELDREFGQHLASFVACHTQLGSTLTQAKAEMEAAAKAAQEEARKRKEERAKKGTAKSPSNETAPSAASSPPPPAAPMELFQDSQPTTGPAEGGNPTTGGENPCKLSL
jgi:PRTRC genetic system protein E